MSSVTHDFFEKDNAVFRRLKNKGTRLVDDVFDRDSRSWLPYTGDRLAPAVYGDRTRDPMEDDDDIGRSFG